MKRYSCFSFFTPNPSLSILSVTVALLFATSLDVWSFRNSEIDRFKAVFNAYPTHVPTSQTVDAPITGNGDIGLTMAASAGEIVFYVGKNDFWKAVPSYPDGKIALPGGLNLTSDIFSEGTYYAEQLPGNAEIRASFKTDSNELHLCAWVPATDNKVVIELESTGQTRLNLKLWTPQGSESITAQGTEKGCAWVHRSFEKNIKYLQWSTHMAMALNHENGDLILQPGEHKTLVIAIYTNHDTEQWHEQAIEEAASATNKSLAETKQQHHDWWNSFWSLSSINIDDELLMKYYYQSQYLFACASREGKFAPGLWGPFITSDDPAWAGDYHLNYNYQGPYWASFSSNHISLTENYDQPMLDYMESGRKHAQNLFKCRGILYPVGLGPKGLCSSTWPKDQEKMKAWYGGASNTIEDGVMMWQQKTNAAFVAANMMMHFYSTYNEDYARKIYPFILACADFWEDYLTFENGRYVVKGDVFYETPPWTNYEGDFNCVVSLGMARLSFLSANALSRFLKVDKNRRARWDDILEKLSDFPVKRNERGRLSLCQSEKEDKQPSGISRIHMHGVLLPSGLTGFYSTPEYNKIMLADLMEWKSTQGQDWGNSLGNGIETVYPGAARIGFPAKELLKHLKERILMGSYPNCYIWAHGGGIETLSAVPGTINEMMMQSYEGIIRIFPNWDREMNGSFTNLRAYGAFLVSSSMQGGKIENVTLKSEKGRPCQIENPWPGQKVKVIKNGKPWKTLNGNILEFKTKKGDIFEFTTYHALNLNNKGLKEINLSGAQVFWQ